jgi:hypothetical protein
LKFAESILRGITDETTLLWILFNKNHIKGYGCWEWTGDKNSQGYGVYSQKGKTHSAYRLSYRLFNGEIRKYKKNIICHTCDNPGCVNPGHLYAGTAQNNTDDMMSRERSYWQKLRNKELESFIKYIEYLTNLEATN